MTAKPWSLPDPPPVTEIVEALRMVLDDPGDKNSLTVGDAALKRWDAANPRWDRSDRARVEDALGQLDIDPFGALVLGGSEPKTPTEVMNARQFLDRVQEAYRREQERRRLEVASAAKQMPF